MVLSDDTVLNVVFVRSVPNRPECKGQDVRIEMSNGDIKYVTETEATGIRQILSKMHEYLLYSI